MPKGSPELQGTSKGSGNGTKEQINVQESELGKKLRFRNKNKGTHKVSGIGTRE